MAVTTTEIDRSLKQRTMKGQPSPIKRGGVKAARKRQASKASKPAKVKAAGTFTISAEVILRKAAKPLHVNDITEQALKSGLQTAGKTPTATMAARLGSAPDRFTKLGKGMFELKK